MKFLFVVPPLTGHVNPTVSVARALEARGHGVAWVGHPSKVRPLLPDGARLTVLGPSSSSAAGARSACRGIGRELAEVLQRSALTEEAARRESCA